VGKKNGPNSPYFEKKENHQMSTTGPGQQVAKNIKGFF
jgi:hypothetical protein